MLLKISSDINYIKWHQLAFNIFFQNRVYNLHLMQ